MMATLRAPPVFLLVVLVTLGLAVLNGLMVLLMQLQPGFMAMAHFTDPRHRTHDLTFGFLFVPTVVGMLAQLRSPSKNVAGQLMALIPWVGLMLTLLLTSVLTNNTNVLNFAWIGVATSTFVATVFHPTGRNLFRWFRVFRVSRLMLALVVTATVPLLAFASANIGLQGPVTNDHVMLGHYGFMAAFSFTVIGVGFLASLRPDGWRLTAWVAGLLALLLGLTSIVLPDVDSSLGLVGSLAAIGWGVGFVATAESIRRSQPAADLTPYPDSDGDHGLSPDRGSSSTPAWVYVLGVVALALALLLGSMHLAGGGPGPGLHSTPGGGHAAPTHQRSP